MILCRQLLILFFFMLLGFCMAKGKILDQHNSGFLSLLIVNVANPALILSGGIGTSMDRRELFKVALVAAGVYLLLIVVSEGHVPPPPARQAVRRRNARLVAPLSVRRVRA